MIRFAICDDNPYMLKEIAQRLKGYIETTQYAYELLTFPHSKELLESSRLFDVLFLDIHMTEPDGMEAARLLRTRGYEGLIIYITVLKDCVFDSFETGAFDYLLKPLDDRRFINTMNRVVTALKKQSAGHILIRQGNSCRIVPLDEIVYCEVIGRKLYVHTKSEEIIDYYCRLDHLEQSVDCRFFRCHRSYLVNLDWVRGLKDGNALLPGDKEIPVSRLRRQMLTESLLFRMKERRR